MRIGVWSIHPSINDRNLFPLIRFVGYDVVLPGGRVADETADVIVVYHDFPQMSTIGKIRALRSDQRRRRTSRSSTYQQPCRDDVYIQGT
jgi:hypothetical protein